VRSFEALIIRCENAFDAYKGHPVSRQTRRDYEKYKEMVKHRIEGIESDYYSLPPYLYGEKPDIPIYNEKYLELKKRAEGVLNQWSMYIQGIQMVSPQPTIIFSILPLERRLIF
jgi:hypothetical protein